MFTVKACLVLVFCATATAENTPVQLLSGPLQFSNLHVGGSSAGKDPRDREHEVMEGCLLDHVVRAKYDGFALPDTRYQWQIQGTIVLGTGCSTNESSMEIIFSVGAISVVIICNERAVIVMLDSERLPILTFPLYRMTGSMPYNFTLRLSTVSGYEARASFRSMLMSWSSINRKGQEIIGKSESITIDLGFAFEQDSSNIQLGSFEENCDTAVMTIETLEFQDLRGAEWNEYTHKTNNVTWISIECVEMTEINKQVVITSTASLNGSTADSIRGKLMVYGIANACKNVHWQEIPQLHQIKSQCRVAFPLPGKFMIEARFSGGNGKLYQLFREIIVVKVGHLDGPVVVASGNLISSHNTGRPVERFKYRGSESLRNAQKIGMSTSEFFENDLESETLFDYTILSPYSVDAQKTQYSVSHPLHVTTIQDLMVAGRDSPLVPGLSLRDNLIYQGHHKNVVFVPLTYPWASESDVECQQHWTNWHEFQSSVRRTVNERENGSFCSVGCTKRGTVHLIEYSGMFDQFNQALIRDSYGLLSLDPFPVVTEDVIIAEPPLDESTGFDSISYYSKEATKALLKFNSFWLDIVLTPLVYKASPPFRAWSTGRSGQIVITRCFVSLYHALHEASHRFGFAHPKEYLVERSLVRPSDPLNVSGQWIGSNLHYWEKFDVLGCCHGSLTLYNRLAAGWLRPENKFIIMTPELNIHSQEELIMWPFDRPESKHFLNAVIIRRSFSEVVTCGYRSLTHWPVRGLYDDLNHPYDRNTFRGIECEYVKMDDNGEWKDLRSTINFDLLYNWGPTLDPLTKEHSLLKEGQAWYDPASKILLLFKGIRKCPESIKNGHIVKSYRGYFVSENRPFQETYDRATYFSGYDCAFISIGTNAARPKPGKIPISMSATWIGTPGPSKLEEARHYLYPSVDKHGQNLVLQLTIFWKSQECEICSIILKNRYNDTLASFFETGPNYPKSPLALFISDDQILGAHIRALSCDGRSSLHRFVEDGGLIISLGTFYNGRDFSFDKIPLSVRMRNDSTLETSSSPSRREKTMQAYQIAVAVTIPCCLLALAIVIRYFKKQS
eukprot:jgi/Picsp_1/6023/NSC_03377-R1_hypothetical protein CHLNCDRAFT_133319 [Chlorella variabilis]